MKNTKKSKSDSETAVSPKKKSPLTGFKPWVPGKKGDLTRPKSPEVYPTTCAYCGTGRDIIKGKEDEELCDHCGRSSWTFVKS